MFLFVFVFLFLQTSSTFSDYSLSLLVVHISMFPEVALLYTNRRCFQIPLALQCCSNGKCAYARRSHPGGFTFSTKALPGQQFHKKKWNNIMKMVMVK